MTRPNWFTLLKTTVCLFIAGTLDGLHVQAVRVALSFCVTQKSQTPMYFLGLSQLLAADHVIALALLQRLSVKQAAPKLTTRTKGSDVPNMASRLLAEVCACCCEMESLCFCLLRLSLHCKH